MNRHLTVGSHEANGRKQADCTSDAEAQPLFSECDGRPLNRAAKALLVLAVTSAGTAAAVRTCIRSGSLPVGVDGSDGARDGGGGGVPNGNADGLTRSLRRRACMSIARSSGSVSWGSMPPSSAAGREEAREWREYSARRRRVATASGLLQRVNSESLPP